MNPTDVTSKAISAYAQNAKSRQEAKPGANLGKMRLVLVGCGKMST